MTEDDGLVGRPRCLCCRRPFDAHLVDEDHPDRETARVCPYPPSKRERYLPDTEHAALSAENERLRDAGTTLKTWIDGYTTPSEKRERHAEFDAALRVFRTALQQRKDGGNVG